MKSPRDAYQPSCGVTTHPIRRLPDPDPPEVGDRLTCPCGAVAVVVEAGGRFSRVCRDCGAQGFRLTDGRCDGCHERLSSSAPGPPLTCPYCGAKPGTACHCPEQEEDR